MSVSFMNELSKIQASIKAGRAQKEGEVLLALTHGDGGPARLRWVHLRANLPYLLHAPWLGRSSPCRSRKLSLMSELDGASLVSPTNIPNARSRIAICRGGGVCTGAPARKPSRRVGMRIVAGSAAAVRHPRCNEKGQRRQECSGAM